MISNNEKREQVIRLFKEENKTPKSLAEEFDVPISTIYVWVRGVKKTITKDEVCKLYLEEHKTPKVISEENNTSLKVVYDWLSMSGVELTEEEQKEYEEVGKTSHFGHQLGEINRLRLEVKELKEQNKVLQDSLKYLTELLNIKNEELKKS